MTQPTKESAVALLEKLNKRNQDLERERAQLEGQQAVVQQESVRLQEEIRNRWGGDLNAYIAAREAEIAAMWVQVYEGLQRLEQIYGA